MISRRRVLVGSLCAAGGLGCAPTALDSAVDEILHSALEDAFERERAAGFVGAVLVQRDGRTIFDASFGLDAVEGGSRPIFDVGSISKQFTGAAVVLLAMRERLRTTATISEFFPRVPSDKASITIEQLASHASGLSEHAAEGLGDFAPMSQDEAMARIFATPLRFAPGEGFEYSNSGYTLLAIIAERVAGAPFQAFVQSELFGPLGMRAGWYRDARLADAPQPLGFVNGEPRGAYRDWPEASWALIGNGGVVTTLADLALWQEELRRPGIMPEGFADRLCAPLGRSGGIHGDSEERPVFEGFGCTSESLTARWRRSGHNGAGTATGNNASMDLLRGPAATFSVIAASPRLEVYPLAGESEISAATIDWRRSRFWGVRAGDVAADVILGAHPS